MAFEEKAVFITVPAGADLSTHQYKAVKLNASGQAILATVAGETFIGWLQNKPDAAGKAATIAIYGRAKVMAGGNLVIGDVLSTNGSAKAVKATAFSLTAGTPNTLNDGFSVCGVAMSAGADTEIIDALIQLPISMVAKDLTAQT